MNTKEYVVEKSKYPEGEKDYLVVMNSKTEYGINYQRVFKGTRNECFKKQKELTEKEMSKCKMQR